MSLRDFNAPFPNDPRALHNEPLGNSAGLESFHTTQPEDIAPSKTPKIVGAVAVALMIGAAGVALYASAGRSVQPKAVVAANAVSAPVQPAPAPQPVAMTPDANMPATPPAAADNAPAPAAPVKEASAPVPKKHRLANADSTSATSSTPASESANSAAAARMAADATQSTAQPVQQQAVTAPAPSPSDVATNNTQSGVAVPPNATTAADMPTTAQNNPAAPPQAQSPAAPTADQPAGGAAAQSAGQVNQ